MELFQIVMGKVNREDIWIYLFLLTGLFLLLAISCKKEEDQSILTATDINGNVYNTVTIGTQIWMKENLKTTRYNDGTSIPLVVDNTEWMELRTPGYTWHNNDRLIYRTTYGALYNWYAVNTSKLCPSGWHVPTDEEWTTLTEYLINNGYGYEGSGNDIAKSLAARSDWSASSEAGSVGNDLESNDSTGFTALPVGYRNTYGGFTSLGRYGFWWSSTGSSADYAWYRRIDYHNSEIGRGDDHFTKFYGFSVRCIKDN
jgi:uncharacterized protein (TIGR02145 family)